MAAATDRRAEDVAEDVEFILDTDRLATTAQVAARLGYRTKSGLQKALEARPDLLDRLARNAELAGFSVPNRRKS
jgi:hypothetical protein